MALPVMAAAALAGRLLLAAIFLHEAWSKLTGYSAALAYMQAFGVPGQLLPLAIAVELGCGVLIPAAITPVRPRCCLPGFASSPPRSFTPSSAIATSSCISRRIWRSPAGFSCCSPMAAAHGPSTRCAHREGEGRRVSGRGKNELPFEARGLVNLLKRRPERQRHCRELGIAALEPFARPRD